MYFNNKYPHFELAEINDTFFATPEYYEKIKNVQNIQKFIETNLIIQNVNFDTRLYINKICQKKNLKIIPYIEVDRHRLIIDLVLQNLGICFATKQYIQEYLDNKQLV